MVGGRARKNWWRQKAAERQLKTMLKEISESAWEQRQQEYGRRGEGKRGTEESNYGGDGWVWDGKEFSRYAGTGTGESWVGG